MPPAASKQGCVCIQWLLSLTSSFPSCCAPCSLTKKFLMPCRWQHLHGVIPRYGLMEAFRRHSILSLLVLQTCFYLYPTKAQRGNLCLPSRSRSCDRSPEVACFLKLRWLKQRALLGKSRLPCVDIKICMLLQNLFTLIFTLFVRRKTSCAFVCAGSASALRNLCQECLQYKTCLYLQ